MPGEIRVTVKSSESLPFTLLEPFQGALKALEEPQYQKLKGAIEKLGFSFAVHIWKSEGKNYILDGHQRIQTVKRMVETEGYSCPAIPVNVVEAKDIKEAKRKVLAAASQYGHVQQQGLFDFMKEADVSFEELEGGFDFPEINIQDFKAGFFDTPIPKDSTGSKDLTEMGNTKLLHTCPKCGFEFGTT